MKKLIIILLLASCSPKVYDFQAEGKQPVKYQKAQKQKVRYVKLIIVSGLVGYLFISQNYDTNPD